MSLNTDSKIRIDKYISDHSECQLKDGFPISLQGKKKVLTVYRLPTDLLFYNIRNGRFAAEYKELVKREGGHLRPEISEDSKKIKEMLLNLEPTETKRTYKDLKVRGQWNCGVITEDGYVIDGNRRMSIISKLYEDTGLDEWKYLEVARLEESISPEDLWTLEAGIQLGKDEIVRYGPINDLLKLREGKEAGLSEKAIVNTLYGYDKEEEIKEKLNRLELIDQYLTFVGIPEKYSQVKNKVEHFINLQNIIKECKNRDYEPEKIIKIKKTAFQLIKEGIQHLELRKIRQIIEKDLTDAIIEIEAAGSELKPTAPQEKNSEEIIEENKGEMTPTYIHFVNAADVLDVSNNEGKEFLLLSRAEKNLRPLLDYQGNELSSPKAISLIEKILRYSEELKKKYSS